MDYAVEQSFLNLLNFWLLWCGTLLYSIAGKSTLQRNEAAVLQSHSFVANRSN